MARARFILTLLAAGWLPATWADAPVPEAVRAAAAGLIPGAVPDSVSASPVPGLFAVVYGPQLFYMSGDGRYIVNGDIIDVQAMENVTETARKQARANAVDSLDEQGMIVFAPARVLSTITVFTDVTCPYCAQLHREVAELNASGVKVRYLAYPRSGAPSPIYDQMVSVWCADDPRQALTEAKAGRQAPPKQCINPVAEHFAMGQSLGVQGTPTIILQDGTLLGGYVPQQELVKLAAQAAGG